MEYACTVLLQIFIGTHTCRAYGTDPVLEDHTVWLSLVEHLLVPVDQPLWFGHLLFGRVAVKDVVISLTRWASPNMSCQKTEGEQKKGLNFTPHWWSIGWCALIRTQWVYIIGIPIVLAELQIANEYFVVDVSSIGTRTEKVNTVQVRDVHTSERKHRKIKAFQPWMVAIEILNFMNKKFLAMSGAWDIDVQ